MMDDVKRLSEIIRAAKDDVKRLSEIIRAARALRDQTRNILTPDVVCDNGEALEAWQKLDQALSAHDDALVASLAP